PLRARLHRLVARAARNHKRGTHILAPWPVRWLQGSELQELHGLKDKLGGVKHAARQTATCCATSASILSRALPMRLGLRPVRRQSTHSLMRYQKSDSKPTPIRDCVDH